ncbi:hypothetical protein [Oceanimonas sp. MB9]|uniref:hypothetical protein n=1 Tax=Oceanimonas sp. MB9 TaxID=2588453 RepID=UPI0013F5A322|nr:hypothetical protein [Oceanimonas sp. MB9]NHI00525.1 hypothetical protein [Oceanimonas sp. MB9]
MASEDNGWQLITLSEFACPAPPASSRLRQGLRRLGRVLGWRQEADGGEHTEVPDFEGFDRDPALEALSAFCQDWPQARPEVRFLLDPPFSGSAAIARDWAERRGWPVLQPPDEAELLAQRVDDWWARQGVRGPWLLDDLARYFLRTPNGMVFLRALLVRLLQGEFGSGLVVCNSWLCRFVAQGFELVLPHCYCFAPATPALLQALGIRAKARRLEALAAEARGNPGVALALWATDHQQQIPRPELPAEAGDVAAFVFYALLLHNGLTPLQLLRVLPMLAPEQLAAWLQRLEYCGQLVLRGERWQLSPVAYPQVRDFLAGRDHCLDDF